MSLCNLQKHGGQASGSEVISLSINSNSEVFTLRKHRISKEVTKQQAEGEIFSKNLNDKECIMNEDIV